MTGTEKAGTSMPQSGLRSSITKPVALALAALILAAAPVTFANTHLALNQAVAAGSQHRASNGSGDASGSAQSGEHDGHCGYMNGGNDPTADC